MIATTPKKDRTPRKPPSMDTTMLQLAKVGERRLKVLAVLLAEEGERPEGMGRRQGGVSPSEIAGATGDTLGSVAYHVRTLAGSRFRLIQIRREARVRGAVEHFYELTAAGRRLAQKIPTG